MIAVALMLAVAPQSLPPSIFDTVDNRKAAAAYHSCLRAQASKLERSGEEVSEVIAAARTACGAPREDLQTTMDATLALAEANGGATMPAHRVDRALEAIDRGYADELRLLIIEHRADRAGKK
jgi:transcription elongation GreA/GreB family factor